MTYPIIVEGVGKRFCKFDQDRPGTLKELFIHCFRGIRPKKQFWALRDVTFSVKPGNMLGVVGRNGSGKSTLLHLIGGVLRPDEGYISTRGRVGALIELGSGFHPELTGRENVFVYGVVAGLTRREVAGKFDSIVSFAELARFIDSPFRTYSSGMKMRLAFAVAAHTEPEVLLIDEVLSVGDIGFQQKCLHKIAELKSAGCTMVFVSHDLQTVSEVCDEALWIHFGQPAVRGEPSKVIAEYAAAMSNETRYRTPDEGPIRRTSSGLELRLNENRFGSLEVEILNVRLLDTHGVEVSEIECGAPLCVQIEYHAPSPVDSPIFGITISSRERNDYFDMSTESSGLTLPQLHGQGRIGLTLDRLDLKNGEYFIDVGVYERNWEYAYDYHWHVYSLTIHSKFTTKGVLIPPHQWRLIAVRE
jgi:lipopolysaccharide transport system ATP-binding protein